MTPAAHLHPAQFLDVTSLDQEGRGVARVDGKAVFVEGALPGEEVTITTLRKKPNYEIARAEGPERIAPDWWRDGPGEHTRDYYRVEDSEGRRFWLFRAGFYRSKGPPPGWFMHGIFA